MKYLFGVDVGGTSVKCGLFTEYGVLEEKWEIPTDTTDSGSHILEEIARSLNEAVSRNSLSASDIEGIGIGVPGPVEKDGTVNKCINLGWGVFNIEAELSELTGYKVKAGNDANVAALGEMWQGGARGHANVIMITLGTGVGGGVIVDGKVVTGNNGAAGEIGHITVNPHEKEPCSCGRRGCLEQYASATGIVAYAEKYLKDNQYADTVLDTENLTSKAIFDAAREGDAAAHHIAEITGDRLGNAMATLACVMNPEIFVIGGGVSKAGEILIDSISRGFRKNAFHAVQDTEIVTAELGNDAGIYGCAYLISESR